MQTKNQIAIITGAASGMGAATARYFAKAGIQTALLDRNIDAAKKVAEEFKGAAIACDVTDAANVESALAHVTEKFGVPRICINCAGVAPAARMVGKQGPLPLDDFKRAIEINLIGTFNVMRLAAAAMTKLSALETGERGVIINTASVAAYEGQIGQVTYSASKGGVVAMTLPAARELAQFGIRVMTIAPGLMHTPMLAGLPTAVQEQLPEHIPFPHRLGEAEEYAALALHIVENTYLNGEVIRLDAALRLPIK